MGGLLHEFKRNNIARTGTFSGANFKRNRAAAQRKTQRNGRRTPR
jgi:hypothetical protein